MPQSMTFYYNVVILGYPLSLILLFHHILYSKTIGLEIFTSISASISPVNTKSLKILELKTLEVFELGCLKSYDG